MSGQSSVIRACAEIIRRLDLRAATYLEIMDGEGDDEDCFSISMRDARRLRDWLPIAASCLDDLAESVDFSDESEAALEAAQEITAA